MDEELLEHCTVAVLLTLGRVELARFEQIEILEKALERLRLTEQVDEAALLQVVGGAS